MGTTASKPKEVTPGKMAVIGLLGVVLIGVVAMQFSGDEGTPGLVKRRAPKSGSSAAAENPAAPPPAVARVRWPEISREEVLAFDPFALPLPLRDPLPVDDSLTAEETADSMLPANSAQPASPDQMAADLAAKEQARETRMRAQERKSRITRMRTTATELQKQGVGVVLTTSAGGVARIGEQEVRVGDVINDVLRVVEITSLGIIVEEAPTESPTPRTD